MTQPKRRRGWISSLKDDPNSTWGNVEDFYEDISSIEAQPDGRIIVNSQVWGRIRGSERPVPGDGFAFYHSSRAKFPPRDQFRRSPRVSLVGELLDVRFSGEEIEMISVAVEPRVISALQARPIVRDDKTKLLFERSVPPGPPYSLYPVEPEDWSRIQELTQLGLAELRLLEDAYPTAAEFDHYARTVLEGASTTKPATVRKRCDALLAIAREHYRGADGILRCEVCQWARPSQISADIVELHHRNPLAAAPHEGRELTLDDAVASLSPLCPNCHRVAHAKPDGSIYSTNELRGIISQSNVA